MIEAQVFDNQSFLDPFGYLLDKRFGAMHRCIVNQNRTPFLNFFAKLVKALNDGV